MDLRQLKYFVRIMECGSLTRAAAALHLSQPALGEHLRKLEDELGVELFVRHSRGIAPTAAAQLLRERAEHLLAYAAETSQLLRETREAIEGRVTLGVSPGLNELFSAELIERCRVNLPGIVINVVEDLSGALVERMARGGETLDLALASGFDSADEPAVESIALASERLFLIGRPARLGASNDVCEFAELALHPLILLGSGDSGRPHGLRRFLLREAAACGIELNIAGELRSIAAVRELVERDAGVTILPLAAVRQAINLGTVVARGLRNPAVSREIHLLQPTTRRTARAVLAIREALLDLVEARLTEPRSPLCRLGS